MKVYLNAQTAFTNLVYFNCPKLKTFPSKLASRLAIYLFSSKILLRMLHWYLGGDDRIILKRVFNEQDRRAWTGLIWLRLRTSGGVL